MRILNLTLKNFRGFQDASLDLDRPLTVLFGINGSGKSSVLQALCCTIAQVLRRAYYTEIVSFPASNFTYPFVESEDIATGESSFLLESEVVDDNRAHIVRLYDLGYPIPPDVLSKDRGPLLSKRYQIAIFYSASRDVVKAHDVFRGLEPMNGNRKSHAVPAIEDSLVPGILKFRSLFQWFKEREDIENENKVAQQNLGLEDPQLAAVRRAVAGMLPGFSGLRIQRDPLHMVIRKGEQLLMLDQLSDGEKLMLAMTADLARRLAMIYTELDDPLLGEAIVLIDEIELHLHPTWQRKVLGGLRTTFPNCQFIVTTHSPQVLSEVPNDAVWLVEDFQFHKPSFPTFGRDSNAILSESMGTTERPESQSRTIKEISELLDNNEYEQARTKLNELADKLSEQDREIVGLRTMLHFMEDTLNLFNYTMLFVEVGKRLGSVKSFGFGIYGRVIGNKNRWFPMAMLVKVLPTIERVQAACFHGNTKLCGPHMMEAGLCCAQAQRMAERKLCNLLWL
jgi:predicted ATP-binding protein involved in virulence